MASLRKLGAGVLLVAGVGFAVLGQALPTGPFASTPGWLLGLTSLWLPFVLGGVVLYLLERGTVQRVVGDRTAVLSGTTDGPLDRHEIVAATNWKRMNALILRRSLGIAATVAGFVALLVSGGLLGSGNDASAGVAVLWVLVLLGGIVLVLTSRRSSDEVKHDYTHRVSVRIPDLFSLHSFHVHLRQIAEDQGYVVTDATSPGRGGSPARFDEEVYLSEGGFKARKRPIAPSLSLLPDDSPYADVLNLTTGSLVLALVGASLLVTGLAVVGILFALVGLVLFAYDYVRRTRQWAELYCIEEGTVYTPTANVHDGEPPGEGVVHHEPAVSAAESSTEMIVTLGAKNSVYFDDEDLAADFQALVGQLDDVASENSYTLVDEATHQRPPVHAENGR